MHKFKDKNTPVTAIKNLLTIYGSAENQQYFYTELEINSHLVKFLFTNDDELNTRVLLDSFPDFFETFETVIKPQMDNTCALKHADLMNANYWREIMHEQFADYLRDPSIVRYARTNPSYYSMGIPSVDSSSFDKLEYNLKIYAQPKLSPNLKNESELMDLAQVFFGTLISVYSERVSDSPSMPKPIKEAMVEKIYNLTFIHNKIFGLPEPARLVPVEPIYSASELILMEGWKVDFNAWWEKEGVYLRAGGGEYEKSFAWASWKNREIFNNQNKMNKEST